MYLFHQKALVSIKQNKKIYKFYIHLIAFSGLPQKYVTKKNFMVDTTNIEKIVPKALFIQFHWSEGYAFKNLLVTNKSQQKYNSVY